MTPHQRYREVIESVGAQHDVTVAQILGEQKTVAVVSARRAVIDILDREYGLTQSQICSILRRNRTAVYHAIKINNAQRNGARK